LDVLSRVVMYVSTVEAMRVDVGLAWSCGSRCCGRQTMQSRGMPSEAQSATYQSRDSSSDESTSLACEVYSKLVNRDRLL